VIATGLRLAGPSLMVLIRDAPDHAIGEMIRWLAKEGWEADVALDPRQLIDADPKRVWILPARTRQARLLNELRPRLRGVRLVLWIAEEEAALLAEAPDFVDWASHFAVCPVAWRIPSFVTAGFTAASERHGRIHWDSDEPPPHRPELGELPELRFWSDLCEQASDPSRAEQPIVRVPPIHFFVRRGGWALVDLDTRAPRVLWSPRAEAYGWWRIHGRTQALEDAVALLGDDRTRLAALCDGEPERIALAGWLLEHGHSTVELEAAALDENPDAPGKALLERALAESDVRPDILAARFGPWGLEPRPGLVDEYGPTPLAHRYLQDAPQTVLHFLNTTLASLQNGTGVFAQRTSGFSALNMEINATFSRWIERVSPDDAVSVLKTACNGASPHQVAAEIAVDISRSFLSPGQISAITGIPHRLDDLSASDGEAHNDLLWLFDEMVDNLDTECAFTTAILNVNTYLSGHENSHHDEHSTSVIIRDMCRTLASCGEVERSRSPQLIDAVTDLEERLLYNGRDNISAALLPIALICMINISLKRWEPVYGWTQNLLGEEVLTRAPSIHALAGYAAAACGDLLIALSHLCEALRRETRTRRRRQLLVDAHQLLARVPTEVSDEDETSAPRTAAIDPTTLLTTLQENPNTSRISALLAHLFSDPPPPSASD